MGVCFFRAIGGHMKHNSLITDVTSEEVASLMVADDGFFEIEENPCRGCTDLDLIDFIIELENSERNEQS